MLNKIKKRILPMLDTLGEAIIHYFTLTPRAGEDLLTGIEELLNVINKAAQKESPDILSVGETLMKAVRDMDAEAAERLYPLYCDAIEGIPAQYKAVFLPYYDNTWDSLKSVYEAFARDPQYITEIVIIPIMRNTPEGFKLVYRDYLTPEGIPNTPFQQYSFEIDKPDLVFYNNPYDGVNIEQFRSHVIKPHVGRMVYIPYYLYRYAQIEKENMTDELERSTQLPGHDNADIFIAQGDSFLKRFRQRSENGWKMVALGNPKTDNLYRSIQSFPKYPEWEKIFEGKTVFFLNTHYSVIVKNGWTAWIPYLLQYILDHNDLVLLWRPHPQSFLMTGVNGRTGGELHWKRCLEIADSCERIILDRTSSAVSAMMYSDAVISGHSSIVAEAIFMNKPVFILSYNPMETIPQEKWDEFYTLKYFKKVSKAREFDPKNLLLFSAVCYLGLLAPIPSGESYWEYLIKNPIRNFIEDIKNGIDRKKELRALYRNQLFVNDDGTCGEKIHEYISGLFGG